MIFFKFPTNDKCCQKSICLSVWRLLVKTLLSIGKEIDGDVDSVVGVVFHCNLVIN